uniref:Transposase (Putative), gypsy type n=1 Tax=Tanacetum cinerariifolium TaxID=118510 RepID=A0A6L2N3Q5_TANCI|nr:transposase (putative), gypsy type [Tanacetum cinerariifolium]
MGRDTIQLENVISTISHEYLLEFTSEYGIPKSLHPEFPGPENPIVEFSEGKVAIGAAKVSHFEINCRVLNIIPTLNLFRVFYIPSFNSGWMSFSKRPDKNTPQCYTKPLDSLKNWNNRFFWVDEKVFPIVVDWRINALKDEMPFADSYSAVAVATLKTRRTPIQKQPEALLCLVGPSQNYFLGDDVYPTFLYDDERDMDLFNLISAPNPTKVKTGTRPRAANEKSPLDFADEDPPPVITERGDEATAKVIPESSLRKEVIAMGPVVNKRHRKRGNKGAKANAPPKVLRKDHVASHPSQSTLEGKSLAAMGIEADSTGLIPVTQKTPLNAKSMSDPDPLSYVEPRPIPEQDIAKSSRKMLVAKDPDSKKSTSFTSMVGSLGSIYQPRRGVTNNCRLDTPAMCQDVVDHIVPPGYFSELRHLPNDDFLSQYNINLARQVAMGSQLRLRFEQEAKLLKKAVAQVARQDQRIEAREKHIKNLEALLEADADMKGAAEAKNVKLAKELESLRVQFSDLQLRHVFADVVSSGIANGMSEGIKHGVEYAKAKVDLAAIEVYDPEANTKYVVALHALKDLKYPLVDQLEKLKDAPIDVIMASLFLENDSGEDAPQWICKLRPNSSQIKILIYPEVRNPKDLWSFKEEILLEDAIAANISRAEKKKKCRVVCRPHGVSSVHHARSYGVPVLVPTVAPQGLAILLEDVATQTEITEHKASSRLLRSKSLHPMYNLDWP